MKYQCLGYKLNDAKNNYNNTSVYIIIIYCITHIDILYQ